MEDLLQFSNSKHDSPPEWENKTKNWSICWDGAFIVEYIVLVQELPFYESFRKLRDSSSPKENAVFT